MTNGINRSRLIRTSAVCHMVEILRQHHSIEQKLRTLESQREYAASIIKASLGEPVAAYGPNHSEVWAQMILPVVETYVELDDCRK